LAKRFRHDENVAEQNRGIEVPSSVLDEPGGVCRPLLNGVPEGSHGCSVLCANAHSGCVGRFAGFAVSSLPDVVPMLEHPSMFVGLPRRSAVSAG
jgi:hypothetical protein